MDEIKHMRRRNTEKNEKVRLEGEDMRESRELRHYYVSALTIEVAKLMPFSASRSTLDPDAQKALEGRQSGSTEWIRSRGEDGRTGPQDNNNGSREPQ